MDHRDLVALNGKQGFNGCFGPVNRRILNRFAHAIKQHDPDGFRILTDGKCAQRCQRHQKKFVEGIPPSQPAQGQSKHRPGHVAIARNISRVKA
jgi:hypothetical protein